MGMESCPGRRVASFRIWNILRQTESEQRIRGNSDEVTAVAIREDGTRVSSASYDGTVRVWDARTGDEIGPPLQSHIDFVTCVSLSPDGRWLVFGSDDYTLRLWDLETHAQVGNPFGGHTHFVRCVSFRPDGRRVLSFFIAEKALAWTPCCLGDQMTELFMYGILTRVNKSEKHFGAFVRSRLRVRER